MRPIRFTPVFALFLLPWSLGCAGPETPEITETSPGEWRQFRGPNGQGVSMEGDLPLRWQPGSRFIRWQTPIPGSGDSSPIVSRGRVFLTTVYGDPSDDREWVTRKEFLNRVALALDLESGEILWQTPIFHGPKGKIHWLNTHATPTPVTDGETVFVSFDAHLAALDFDGRIVWKKDLDPGYYDYSHYGVASSPVLTSEAVILFQDREEGDSADIGWLAAFDKQSGDELWRHEWDNTCCSYTTPVVFERDSRELLLVTTSQEARAHDAGTGEIVWQVAHKNTQPVPSATIWGDFVTFPGAIHDALLSTFRLGGPTETPEFLWATRRSVPDIPSPVYYDGKLFTTTTSGLLTIFDPETGHVVRKGRLPGGGYRAALVAGDGKVYAFADNGTTAVIDGTVRRFKLLKENTLGEGSGATPAIAGGTLLIRGSDHLFRIGQDPKPKDAGA